MVSGHRQGWGVVQPLFDHNEKLHIFLKCQSARVKHGGGTETGQGQNLVTQFRFSEAKITGKPEQYRWPRLSIPARENQCERWLQSWHYAHGSCLSTTLPQKEVQYWARRGWKGRKRQCTQGLVKLLRSLQKWKGSLNFKNTSILRHSKLIWYFFMLWSQHLKPFYNTACFSACL